MQIQPQKQILTSLKISLLVLFSEKYDNEVREKTKLKFL